ncbi:hypothetical protein HGRIS_011647 [Hohenbuehelia grisea]|uniref:F-box protein n=1 Tax=Hohenbuehelia grisea TaxID=104357 RepID=A0ABR3JWQ5_9AGAR
MMGSSLSSIVDETESPYTNTRRTSIIPFDVASVRQALLHLLPRELVDRILDLADYKPRIVSYREQKSRITAGLNNDNDVQELYMLSEVIPHTPLFLPKELLNTMHISSVTFTIESHDQGWGGEPEHQGSYHATWSWLEAAIIRPGEPNGELGYPELKVDGESRWLLQRNVHASGDLKKHVVTWRRSSDEPSAINEQEVLEEYGCGLGKGFVDVLRPGDQVAIIYRARYPGWANTVYSAEIGIDISI